MSRPLTDCYLLSISAEVSILKSQYQTRIVVLLFQKLIRHYLELFRMSAIVPRHELTPRSPIRTLICLSEYLQSVVEVYASAVTGDAESQ